MAKIGGNPQNFEKGTNFKDRPDRAVEAGRKGGLAKGENYRKRKLLKEELELLLEMIDNEGHTNQEKISMALLKKASQGDTRAFEVIRDTIGEKPIEVQQVQEVPMIKDDV
jgi:hypothetical protein